jgi:hypothetical protein
VYVGVAEGCAAGGGEGRNHPAIARPDATTASARARNVGQRDGPRDGGDHAGDPAVAPGNPLGAAGRSLGPCAPEGPPGGYSDMLRMVSLITGFGIDQREIPTTQSTTLPMRLDSYSKPLQMSRTGTLEP